MIMIIMIMTMIMIVIMIVIIIMIEIMITIMINDVYLRTLQNVLFSSFIFISYHDQA